MSAWGDKDFKASPGTVALSGLTVTGTNTFFANNFAVGDVIAITDSGGNAVIEAISNNTILTLVSNTELTAGTLSGKAYAVSEKPAYVIDTDTNILGRRVFGVDTTEAGFKVFRVATVAVANAGSGFANGAVVQISGGTGTSANATVGTLNNSTAVNTLTIVNPGRYTVAPTATNNIPSNFLGQGLRVNLTFNTLQANVAHAGWVHRQDVYTDANGNRREKTEVLVAMSTITSDAADDARFPEA